MLSKNTPRNQQANQESLWTNLSFAATVGHTVNLANLLIASVIPMATSGGAITRKQKF